MINDVAAKSGSFPPPAPEKTDRPRTGSDGQERMLDFGPQSSRSISKADQNRALFGMQPAAELPCHLSNAKRVAEHPSAPTHLPRRPRSPDGTAPDGTALD